MNKLELQNELKEVREELSTLIESYNILKDSSIDCQASSQAYKMENKRLKDKNAELKANLVQAQSDIAAQKNRGNQLAFRKKELEHELNRYRLDLDSLGKHHKDNIGRIISMMRVFLTEMEIKTDQLQKTRSWFPHIYKKNIREGLSILSEMINSTNNELDNYG